MLEVEIIIFLVMIIINNDVRTPMMQGVASHTQGGDALEATTERGSPGLEVVFHFGNDDGDTIKMKMMIYDDNSSLNEDLTEGLYRAEGRREAGAIRGALPSRQSR